MKTATVAPPQKPPRPPKAPPSSPPEDRAPATQPACYPQVCEVHRHTPQAYAPNCPVNRLESWNRPDYRQPPTKPREY